MLDHQVCAHTPSLPGSNLWTLPSSGRSMAVPYTSLFRYSFVSQRTPGGAVPQVRVAWYARMGGLEVCLSPSPVARLIYGL